MPDNKKANPHIHQIRSMTPQDLPTVVEIDRRSFPTAWTEASYRNDLSNPRCKYLVAEKDREVIAYAGMWVVEEEAHITTLAVHPDYRRRKVARALLSRLIIEARSRGAKLMTLEVREANVAAVSLYEAFGFSPIGKIRHYYLDTGEDAAVMRLDPLRLPPGMG